MIFVPSVLSAANVGKETAKDNVRTKNRLTSFFTFFNILKTSSDFQHAVVYTNACISKRNF
ncbi:MAG TPA: hypothetical protein DCL64_02020 [Ruminococcaceae bacterium]|nr:hypothetical protein [Oscillospiraceae bacterium]HCB90608.1 hypothetical protein [Oscillospiraceae bacterium]